MMPREHLIASLILAAICYPFLGINSLLIIIGGFLIDVDHYILYVARTKDLNLINAYNYFAKLKNIKNYQTPRPALCVFHTAEFMILLILLSLYSILFAILLGGVVFHVILDLIYDQKNRKEEGRVHSVLIWLIKRDLKKAKL